MNLTFAIVLPGLLLALLGALLVWNEPRVVAALRGFPRSQRAAIVFFGGGAAWFLWRISSLGEADLIFVQKPGILLLAFGALAVLAFFYAPDFLAVRGLCVLTLIGSEPLLAASYMNYTTPLIWVHKVVIYFGLVLALYLAAAPFRVRDVLEWLYRAPGRPRWVGFVFLAVGLGTAATVFAA